MSLQFTNNATGKPVGVLVRLNEWEKITTGLKKKEYKKNPQAGIKKFWQVLKRE